MEGAAPVPPAPPAPAPAPPGVQPAARLRFAAGCHFSRDANGALVCTWDNGLAVNTVRGAAVDYVDPKFHLAVVWTNNIAAYDPGADFGRLVRGGIAPTLALVIVGMRRVIFSLDDAAINIAEARPATAEERAVPVPNAIWATCQTNILAYNALLDAAPTILGCNGLSLLSKGHNYDPTDAMWKRLDNALGVESHTTSLSLSDFDGPIFHDALHPFDITWKTNLVTRLDSPLIGHVNGVVLKRMPGTPAGTALVFVLAAMLAEIAVVCSNSVTTFGPLNKRLDWLSRKIRSDPLKWCTNFQQAETGNNLALVAELEPMAAVAYGIGKVVLSKRSSVLKSKALVNCAKRHGGHETMGGKIGTRLAELDLTEADLDDIMDTYLASARHGITAFWGRNVRATPNEPEPWSDDEGDMPTRPTTPVPNPGPPAN